MKINRLYFSLSKLFFIQCIIFSAISVNADTVVGQAVSVSGKVLVRNEKATNAQMSFLKPGDKFGESTIINTGSNGAVKLLMTDKTIVDLGPSSLFKVTEYKLNQGSDRKVDVSLDYGQIRASVNQPVAEKGKFTIRTKAATMGVRGTEFVVSAALPPKAGEPVPSTQTQVTVIKGRVDVSDLKTPNIAPVQVKAGMQFQKASLDATAKVSQLDAKQIQAVKAEAFQKDMTFLQAVAIEPESKQSSGNEKKEAGGQPASSVPADGPNRGAKQTLANLATAVESQTKAGSIAPTVTDLKLPGVFGPQGTQPRPVDFIAGQPVNVRVQFNPN